MSNLDSHSKRGKYGENVREYGAEEDMLVLQRGSVRSWRKFSETDLHGLCLWPNVICVGESKRILSLFSYAVFLEPSSLQLP